MNKFVRYISSFVCVAMFLQTVGISQIVNAEETLARVEPPYYTTADLDVLRSTPPENVFSVDGKKFILLDVTNDDNSKFLVMSEKSLVKRVYTTASAQSVSNMNEYLNGEFKDGGYLPSSIVNSINYSATWKHEPFMWPSEQDDEVVFTAGITVPAVYEFKKYSDKIGVYDEMGMWTRTPNGKRNSDGNTVLACSGNYKTVGTFWAYDSRNNEFGIRPIFYLKKDFFAKNKIDYLNMGSNVRDAIIQVYDKSELTAYSENERDIIYVKGNVTVRIDHTIDRNNPYIYVSFGDENDKETDYVISITSDSGYSKTVELNRGDIISNTYKIPIADLPMGQHQLTVDVLSDGDVVTTVTKDTVYMMYDTGDSFMSSMSGKGYCTSFPSGLVTEYAKNSGASLIRTGIEWQGIESTKGVYDFTALRSRIEQIYALGAEPVILIAYSNVLYGAESNKHGPSTKTQIDAFAKMAAAIAKEFPEVKYFEIYNEPNLTNTFWKETAVNSSIIDYSYLVQVTYEEIRRVNSNAAVIAGCAADGGGTYTGQILERGIYSQCDAISFHPYMYYNKGYADSSLYAKNSGFTNNALKYGGFKEHIITEVGWPTHNDATNGNTEEKQATELLKQYVLSEDMGIHNNCEYNFYDATYDENDKESNFGVIDNNGRAKKSYAVNSTFMRLTSGAVYCGSVSIADNVNGYIYRKDGKAFMIMWHTYTRNDANNSVVIDESISLGDEKVTVLDMYGNAVQCAVDTVKLGNEPVYVAGLSDKWFAKAMSSYQTKVSDALTTLGVKESVYRYFSDIISDVNTASAESALRSEEDALNLLNKNYEVADSVVSAYKNGTLNMSENVLSGILDTVYNAGMLIVNYYSATVDKTDEYSPSQQTQVTKYENSLANLTGRVSHTSSIVRTAKKYAGEAKTVSQINSGNPSKQGFVKSRDVLASKLLQMAEFMQSAEEITRDDILIISPTNNAKPSEENTSGSLEVCVYNYGSSTLKGELTVTNSDGTEAGTQNVQILSGKSLTKTFTIAGGSYNSTVTATLKIDGQVVKTAELLAVKQVK